MTGEQTLHLCAHLPHWPIDRLRRRRSELRHKPLVLVQTVANRQVVMDAACDCPAGICAGMTLTEARARYAALLDFPATPDADLKSLEALGYWLTRFSPSVCVAPPSSIFLDTTGLERLFGGLENLAARVAAAMKSLRLNATIAIAPTAGAAWALAAFGDKTCQIVAHQQLPAALSPLAVEALRLESNVAQLLRSLGVRTIGALLRLPRQDLVRRFGPGILQRIDQASGAVHEPLTYLPYRSPIRAALEFDGPVESPDTIRLAVQDLTKTIAGQLAERGLGARELRLNFTQPYAPPVEKILRLVRPCRNETAMFKLIGCALETLEAAEGFIAVNLCVTIHQKLDDEQVALIGGEAQRDAAEVDHLVERLQARRNKAVEWGELLESNLPERACRFTDHPPAAASLTRIRAADFLRPLRLLREPRAIKVMVMPTESRDGQPISFTDAGQVHRLHHVRGPERITGQWWRGRWKTRDYFDVCDAAGNRHWIFRVLQSNRWFLHGIFE